MRKVDFKKIKGLAGVSKNFLIPEILLVKLVSSVDQSAFYKKLKIPKKNIKRRRGFRIVYKAEPQVAQFQKNVATAVGEAVVFPKHVQGFVKKRSSSSNADQHLGCKFLLSADIEDFFDSIPLNQVINVFENLGCDSETSTILAQACTLNGILHQGLHTSPAISNLAVIRMDEDFVTLSAKCSAVYTRYADDISISSNEKLPTKEEITDILDRYGFKLNNEKFRIAKRGEAQFVTGLSVFDQSYPRVPKQIKKRLRLELYYINKYGLEGHFDRLGIPDFAQSYQYNRLRGIIDYINAVEPDLAEKFYKLLPQLPNYKRIAEQLIKDPTSLPKIISLKGPKKAKKSSIFS